ncbi:MAG: hypothetical protein J6Y85_01775 [Alphaproteobacteria bacterium]|nr:hypothetical protein [Alphaproteobacteria bacterium]
MKKILLKTTGSIILAAAVVAGTTSLWMEKNIYVSFNQGTDTDVKYQVFYTLSEEENFNESHSVRSQAEAMDSEVKIHIPETHISKFRLDPGTAPGQVTISNLKLLGDKEIELDDFNEFRYSPDVEDKIIENNKITIISNKRDPYMVYLQPFNLNEGNFINKQKIGLIGTLSFFVGFILLGLLFKNRSKRK